MAKAKKAALKKKASPRTSYLTKRRLASAARKGIRIAAAKTMQLMGYTVIVYRGWVVKKYADGKIEKMKRLDKKKATSKISLR
jgi:phage-related protein